MWYVNRRVTTREITFARNTGDTKRSRIELMPAGTKVFVSEKPNAKGFYVARVCGTLLEQYVRENDFEVGA